MTPEIITHLSRDARLKAAIESSELVFPAPRGDLYYSLLRSITFQQLSGKAATTIHGRFLELFPEGYPHPEDVIALDITTLRSVGLSRQKATYIQNVAEFFKQERLEHKDWSTLSDEEIIQYLTQIKGVGKWTVEMILMFTLNRPDVFPLDDLGIQQAIQSMYGLESKGRELKKEMLAIAEAWRPYRTYACVYLWRWKDGE